MQGLKNFIPTERKIAYLNQLLKVGFHTLDFGSFVSPKAIPQMSDTTQVVRKLDLAHTSTKLLAIVANERGASEAANFEEITYLGYPFSVSPTFLKRNINSTLEEAFQRAEVIQGICKSKGKTLVTYVSMAFGNPYGDNWDEEILMEWVGRLNTLDIAVVSLADTTGVANPEEIGKVFALCRRNFQEIEFGLHLHTTFPKWKMKIEAAYEKGCRRFDGVINGLGGCPMAGDKLVGNVNTNWLIQFFEEKGENISLDKGLLKQMETQVL